MGASQSKASEAAIRQQLVERLAALDLELKQQEAAPMYSVEKDYVMLQCANEEPPSYGPREQDISITAAQKWQKELLADPKVCPSARAAALR